MSAAKPSTVSGRKIPGGSIAWYEAEKTYVNMAGDYDYLETPYYMSQDLQLDGITIHPTCEEMLDAYVPPLFLEKARLAGLPLPQYYISNGYFEPPVVIDPINPFMIKSRIVSKPGHETSIAKSMTRNYTYAICCQEIPPEGRIVRFRAVLGWCTIPQYRDAAQRVWEVFRIPLARVRMIVTRRGAVLFSDISQLPFKKLNQREMRHLDRILRWEK